MKQSDKLVYCLFNWLTPFMRSKAAVTWLLQGSHRDAGKMKIVEGKLLNMKNWQKSLYFVICHGILIFMPVNLTKFVSFMLTLSNLASV